MPPGPVGRLAQSVGQKESHEPEPKADERPGEAERGPHSGGEHHIAAAEPFPTGHDAGGKKGERGQYAPEAGGIKAQKADKENKKAEAVWDDVAANVDDGRSHQEQDKQPCTDRSQHRVNQCS